MANMHPNTSGIQEYKLGVRKDSAAIQSMGGKARNEQWKAEQVARSVLEQKVTDVSDYD